jgi:hypothetical protein
MEQRLRLPGWKGALTKAIETVKRKVRPATRPHTTARFFTLGLGDKNETFKRLNTAFVGARLASLRSDPRFAELVRQLGYWSSRLEYAIEPFSP